MFVCVRVYILKCVCVRMSTDATGRSMAIFSCLHMCVSVCMYVCVHVCVITDASDRSITILHIYCSHVYMCECILQMTVQIYAFVCICMYMYVYVYVCVNVCVQMQEFVNDYIYIHTYRSECERFNTAINIAETSSVNSECK